MNYNELSFEETKNIISYFLKENSAFKAEILLKVPKLRLIINKILDIINYAIEHPDCPQTKPLKEEEINQLTYLNYILPTYYLSEEYDIEDFLNTYILLLNNYKIIYENMLTEDFKTTLFALNNLIDVQKNFTKLIQITNILITKYERAKEINDSPYSISKIYLRSLLEENEKEAE